MAQEERDRGSERERVQTFQCGDSVLVHLLGVGAIYWQDEAEHVAALHLLAEDDDVGEEVQHAGPRPHLLAALPRHQVEDLA